MLRIPGGVPLAWGHWQLWLPMSTPAPRRLRGWGAATTEGSLPSPRGSNVCSQPSAALEPEQFGAGVPQTWGSEHSTHHAL